MDRVPLDKAQDKPISAREDAWAKDSSVGIGATIEEIRDMRTMSFMFGLAEGFGENLDKAKYMYEWGKGLGKKPLDTIKSVIKKTGFQETGNLLLKKVYQWVRLQENINDNKIQQELLR